MYLLLVSLICFCETWDFLRLSLYITLMTTREEAENSLKRYLEQARANYHKHKDKIKLYREARADHYKEIHREYYQRNRSRFDSYNVTRALRERNGSHTRVQWFAIRDASPICSMCGRFVECVNLTKDHILPLSKGGSNGMSNIQALCHTCNLSKHDK